MIRNVICLLFIVLHLHIDATSQNLIINEFSSKNDDIIIDNMGEADDWIEIYNASDFPVNIGGLYITDDLSDPMKWQIPTTSSDSTTIEAKKFIILWADNDTEQGILHLNFKLSGGGESIGISSDGVNFIDEITYPEMPDNVSYGRSPDGSGNWGVMQNSTPGLENVNIVTRVYDLKTQENLSVSPNPTIGQVKVINQDGIIDKVFIYDMSGRLLKTTYLDHNSILDVSSFNSGMYYLVIKMVSNTLAREVIVIE